MSHPESGEQASGPTHGKRQGEFYSQLYLPFLSLLPVLAISSPASPKLAEAKMKKGDPLTIQLFDGSFNCTNASLAAHANLQDHGLQRSTL
jgi:hypothetical protein